MLAGLFPASCKNRFNCTVCLVSRYSRLKKSRYFGNFKPPKKNVCFYCRYIVVHPLPAFKSHRWGCCLDPLPRSDVDDSKILAPEVREKEYV